MKLCRTRQWRNIIKSRNLNRNPQKGVMYVFPQWQRPTYLEAILDDGHKALQVWQHRASHEDGNLLHNLDTSVPRLPRLFALTHSLEEWQQCRRPEGHRNNGEGARCRISHILDKVRRECAGELNVSRRKSNTRNTQRKKCVARWIGRSFRTVMWEHTSSGLSMSGRIVAIIVASPAALARFEMISRPSTRA